MSPAEIAERLEGAIEERFLASTGPGGQNVNKVCQSPPANYAWAN